MEKKIIYDNRTFSLGTSGRYYFGSKKAKSISLHRYKYEKEIGPIPKGWHIHHKDGNCFNNSIENLEAIEPKKHAGLHPPSSETISKWQQAGIKVAVDWHRSKEGKAWHEENYHKNAKAALHKTHIRACSNCEKPTETKRKQANVFCSNACKSMWRRNNKPDMAQMDCENCGNTFLTRKYLPARFCSKACKPAPNPYGIKGKPKTMEVAI